MSVEDRTPHSELQAKLPASTHVLALPGAYSLLPSSLAISGSRLFQTPVHVIRCG